MKSIIKNLPILQSIVHFGAALVLGALASCAPMQPTEGPSSTTYIAPNKAFVASEVAAANQKIVKANSFISSATEEPVETPATALNSASATSAAVAEQAPTNTPADASLGVSSIATNTSGNNESSEPTIVVGALGFGGALEGAQISFQLPAPKPAEGNSPEVKAEINVSVKTGVKFGRNAIVKNYGTLKFPYEYKDSSYFYMKGDFKAFDRTATLINYSVPLGDSNGTGTLDL